MPSSLTDIAITFNLPAKALAQMKSDGLLGPEVGDDEIAWFPLLSQVWGKPVYIRMQIEKMSEREKKSLLKTEMTRMEKYILTKFIKEGKSKVKIDDLAVELRAKFGVAITDRLKAKIREIRKTASKESRKAKKRRE